MIEKAFFLVFSKRFFTRLLEVKCKQVSLECKVLFFVVVFCQTKTVLRSFGSKGLFF